MKKIILCIIMSIFFSSCFFTKKGEINIDNKNNTGITVVQTGEILSEEIQNGQLLNDNSIFVESNSKDKNLNNESTLNIEVEKINNLGIDDNIGDKAFGSSLQKFIDKLIENPDFIKDENCLNYDESIKKYCIEKQSDYLKNIVKNKNTISIENNSSVANKIETAYDFIKNEDCSKYDAEIKKYCEKMKDDYINNPVDSSLIEK